MYIFLRDTFKFIFAEIDFANNEAKLTELPLSGTLSHSYFISATNSLYVGFVTQITTITPNQIFSRNIGILMPSDVENSCLEDNSVPNTIAMTAGFFENNKPFTFGLYSLN